MRAGAGRGLVVALAAIAAIGAACVATAPPPGPSGGAGSARPSGSSPAFPPSPTASPSTGVHATPLPPLDPFAGPFRTFTILCAAWDGELPADAISCREAAGLALAAIGGERRGSVRRLDVGFGDPCPPNATCPARADVRWVTARSDAFDSLLVRIARTTSGDIEAWPPVDGPTARPPAFAPPPTRALGLGTDAPAELRAGDPFPFCGTEALAQPDAFDAAARRCFLAGVAAWAPVELVSVDATTEVGVVTTVLRFAGRGSIQRFVRSAGAWAATDCALSPVPTSARFVIVAPCEPHELRP